MKNESRNEAFYMPSRLVLRRCLLYDFHPSLIFVLIFRMNRRCYITGVIICYLYFACFFSSLLELIAVVFMTARDDISVLCANDVVH
jgi:predicted permease